MKKPKTHLLRHELEFSGHTLLVAVAEDLETARSRVLEEYPQLKPDLDGELTCSAMCGFSESHNTAVLLFRQRSLYLTHIVHEITHATNFILDHIRIPYSLDNDEVWAYHNGSLVGIVLRWIQQQKLELQPL